MPNEPLRIPAGNDRDTTYTPVRGRVRAPDGRLHAVEVHVPHDGSLAPEELRDAALTMLEAKLPGVAWADPHGAAVARRAPMTRGRAYRLLAYFVLFVALFTGLSVGGSWAIQKTVLEPACRQYGDARGLLFVSYSRGGGDLLNLGTSYTTMTCYFRGTPNTVRFSDIAGPVAKALALFEGGIAVVGGLVLAAIITWLVGRTVEALVSRRE